LLDLAGAVSAAILDFEDVRAHDDRTFPALVSAAVDGDNKKGVSEAFDIIGFNYNLEFPDEFHKRNPRLPIYGSENLSRN
jgi:hypothetical protein